MATKAAAKGRADLPVSQDAQQRVPTTRRKSSSLLDTRVVYCGDNLEQLAKLSDACVDLIYIDPPKPMQKEEGRMMKPARLPILHSSFTRDRQLLLPLRLARQPLRQSHARPDFRRK